MIPQDGIDAANPPTLLLPPAPAQQPRAFGTSTASAALAPRPSLGTIDDDVARRRTETRKGGRDRQHQPQPRRGKGPAGPSGRHAAAPPPPRVDEWVPAPQPSGGGGSGGGVVQRQSPHPDTTLTAAASNHHHRHHSNNNYQPAMDTKQLLAGWSAKIRLPGEGEEGDDDDDDDDVPQDPMRKVRKAGMAEGYDGGGGGSAPALAKYTTTSAGLDDVPAVPPDTWAQSRYAAVPGEDHGSAVSRIMAGTVTTLASIAPLAFITIISSFLET